MPPRLPPDLDRVGDQLVAAAARDVAARRRRRRLIARTASTAVAALIALAALIPAGLNPAVRSGAGLLLARAPAVEPPGLPAACDQPRGGRLSLPACAAGEPIRLGRPRRW
jgi:hypothetical protein